MLYDVFICHCSTDKKKVVDPLVEACIDAGIKCWIDSQEIQWGDSISQRISDGLLKSRFVLVVISEFTRSRTWQPREIAAALNAENKQGSVRVLPLYVGNRAELEQQLPLLADKHSLIWDNNSLQIAQAIKSKLGHSQPVTSAVSKHQPHIPSLRAPITDVDRDRFLRTAFNEICGYFKQAKSAAEASEPRIAIDLSHPDNEKLRGKLFLDGRSVNECNIWIASLGRHGRISFFAGRSLFNEFNSSNEMISIDDSSGEMKLKGTMGSLSGHTIDNATPEDAAAVLWKWFVESIERRN